MKYNTFYKVCAVGALVFGMTSCELRDELRGLNQLEENEGIMELSLETMANGNSMSTKALVDGDFDKADVDPNSYTVRVMNTTSGAQVSEITYANLAAQGGKLVLDEGKYTVLAFNYDGAAVNASQRPFFLGSTDFQILPGGNTKVNTTCSLQNIEVGIKLSADFLDNFLDDYTVTVTNGEEGNWVFNKDNIAKKVYLKLPSKPVTSLIATIKATTKENNPIVTQVEINKPADAEGGANLKKGDSFLITLNPGSTPVTRFDLSVSVDLTMTETGQTISIPTENIIYNENPGGGGEQGEGITFKGLPAEYTLEEAGTKAIVDINAPRGIKNLYVTIKSTNADFMNIITTMGMQEKFDLVNPGELEGRLTELGLINASDPILNKKAHTFNVTSFMSLLNMFGEGKHTFSIEVNDGVESKGGDLVVNSPAAQ